MIIGSLGLRKLLVLVLVGAVFLLGNIYLVASWLEDRGVVDFARYIRKEFLTGTAITIAVILLILLVKPGVAAAKLIRRCPVCDHRVAGKKSYCPDCGSKLEA